MPNAYYAPKGAAPATPAMAAPDATVKSTSAAIGGIQDIGAAKAFQDHLDAGFAAMQSTMKELPPEVAANLPDPAGYSDSEDKRVAWYMMANDAIAKSNLLTQASDTNASPDALATAASRAPLSKDSQAAVGSAIGRLDNNQKGAQLQGIFQSPTPATGTPAAPAIDPKSQMGRTLKIAMANMAPHADTINSAATAAKIPPQLVMAVAAQESGGNAGATSKTGVKGTMQVTDGTFKDMAAKHPELNLTDRTDPAQSYTAGATYLGELMNQFGGNTDQALAAYNAGPTAIRQAVAKYPTDWKDHLAEFVSAPKGMTVAEKAQETSDYVDKVGSNFKALGGSTAAPAATVPTQNDANMAALKVNPDLVTDPRFKEIKSGLKIDAAQATAQAGAAFKGSIQDRLMQKFRAEQDFKTYQKVNNYNKQIEKISPAAQGILRIDQLVGGLDNNKPIPGFGFGEKAFKNFLQTDASPEARDMRIAFANLFGDIGLATSGQNFTKTEMERLDTRLGNTFWSDESAFRSAIKQQRERVVQQLQNPWNALPDDVKKDLYDAGTMNPDVFGDFKSTLAGPEGKPGAVAASGVTLKSGKKFTVVPHAGN